MALIEWSSDLHIVGPIDVQHKKLIRLINELHDAMLAGHGKDAISDVLKKLTDYTVEHFGFEEKSFAKFHYAEAAAHKVQHDAFVNKITEFKASYDANNIGLSLGIMEFLKNWLTGHIQGTDRKYIPCFQENGLR